MKKAIVLLSAGLDSVVNLAQAVKKYQVTLALTFDYGQKAKRREKFFSQKISEYYKIKHLIIRLNWLSKITHSSLIDKKKELPKVRIEDLRKKKRVLQTAEEVWVPNRNGLFINIAACFAQAYNADFIIAGFNKEEAQTFPDNSNLFVQTINKTLKLSTRSKIKVQSFTQSKDKSEILNLGVRLKIPLSLIWSCYNGGKIMCGECESCVRLKRAIKNSGYCEFLKKRIFFEN